MTITEFLLARITEDRESATQAEWAMQGEWFTTADDQVDAFVQRESPARVLAECAAKRAIVESTYFEDEPQSKVDWWLAEKGQDYQRQTTSRDGYEIWIIKTMAAVYADHPDYDPSWRV